MIPSEFRLIIARNWIEKATGTIEIAELCITLHFTP